MILVCNVYINYYIYVHVGNYVYHTINNDNICMYGHWKQ